MNVLSSEGRYVLMGREVTVEVAVGSYRNGYALGYEVGAPARVLVLWTRSASGDTEASWIWPDQVLQTTGDHILDKLRDRDYTGADQAAFERIYHEAMAVADEPAPVDHEWKKPRPQNPKPDWMLTPAEIRLALSIIMSIVGLFTFVVIFYLNS